MVQFLPEAKDFGVSLNKIYEYLWGYIVNVKFFNKPKVISIIQSPFMSFVSYELLSLGDAFYKEIDDLWNDKTFIELGNELNKISSNL